MKAAQKRQEPLAGGSGHTALSAWGYTSDDRGNIPTVQARRSAMQWFVDAGTYADDGDTRNARRAAWRGLRALSGVLQ